LAYVLISVFSGETDGEVEMAYYTGDHEGIGPRWLTTDGREIEPTHWMHIPEGPKS
jgi:hypothetical protein